MARHPWDVKADLVLERDGQYTLDLRVHRNNSLVPKLGWPARLALKGLKVTPVFVKAE